MKIRIETIIETHQIQIVRRRIIEPVDRWPAAGPIRSAPPEDNGSAPENDPPRF